MAKKLTQEEFIQKAKLIHGEKYDYSLVEYRNAITKIKIICQKHGIFEQGANKHLTGRGCQKCGRTNKLTTMDFIKKAIKICGDNFDYSLVNYETTDKKIKIICNHHGIFEQTPHNHLKKHGCPKCYHNINLTTEQFIEKSRLIHGDLYDYSLVNFINVRNKVLIKKDNIIYEQFAYAHLQGKCPDKPKSKDSKGVKKIIKYLEDNKILFKREYTYPDCKNIFCLPFDFYLPEYNILIEYDGEQHFKENTIFGGKEEFQKRIINDGIKNDYTQKNKISLLRISYFENKNINILLSGFIKNHSISKNDNPYLKGIDKKDL